MNAQRWRILIVVMLLTGATAAFLNRLQGGRRLGPPGLKTIAGKVLGPDDIVVGTNTVALPGTVLSYTSSPLPVAAEEIAWLPKDTTFAKRRYGPAKPTGLDELIDVSIVLMGADRTSIHRPQICLESQGLHIEKSEMVNIPIARPHAYDLPVMKLTAGRKVRKNDGGSAEIKAIFVYWFASDRRLTAQHGERMWWMATDLISTGILPRWAYVTLFSVCLPGDEEKTFNRMKEFIAEAVPEFQIVTKPMAVARGPKPNPTQIPTQN